LIVETAPSGAVFILWNGKQMKLIIATLMMLLSACAQLQKGELQPVKRIDAKEPIYFTTCSGMVEDWASCNRKAMKTCPKGYSVTSKEENPTAGRRDMTFRCN
jgi:hypothetical protein